MKKITLIAISAVALIATSCSGEKDTNHSTRLTKIETSPPAVDATSRFEPTAEELATIQLFEPFGIGFVNAALKDSENNNKGANTIVSPASATILISMLANICSDEARQEITTALGATDTETLNSLNAKIIYQLPAIDPKIELSFANGLWYDNKYSLNPSLPSIMGAYYDVEAFGGDFTNKPEYVVGHMNQWISDNTNGLIKDMRSNIYPGELAILVNTIYFNAKWTSIFDKSKTKKETFHGIGGDTEVDMMHSQDKYNVGVHDDFIAVCKDYGNKAFEMMFILPNDGINATVPSAESIKSADWRTANTNIALPRFEIAPNDKISLSSILHNMGVTKIEEPSDINIFDETVSGCFQVFQKSYIKVDEERTTAASATDSDMVWGMHPSSIRFDRPFTFLLRHKETGLILFGGRVAKL